MKRSKLRSKSRPNVITRFMIIFYFQNFPIEGGQSFTWIILIRFCWAVAFATKSNEFNCLLLKLAEKPNPLEAEAGTSGNTVAPSRSSNRIKFLWLFFRHSKIHRLAWQTQAKNKCQFSQDKKWNHEWKIAQTVLRHSALKYELTRACCTKERSRCLCFDRSPSK